ncbi:MAG: hypothetical protein H6981_02690 [Gammaproteobacteria bacterium]|nr:hypothetical protein [Gammaproteobacteria bacterium]MCP5135697.1 hypothetical protein [Gammaproteobacteria bacterium]
MFKFIRKVLFLLILIVVVVPMVVLVMAVGDRPALTTEIQFSPDDLMRAKALAEANDPRKMTPGEVHNLTLSEADINLLANYAIERFINGGVLIDLQPGAASVRGTVKLPDNPVGDYLNLYLEVYQAAGRVKVQRLQFGDVRIPRVLAQWLLDTADRFGRKDPDYVAVLEAINGYRITEQYAMVMYQWEPDLVKRLEGRGKGALIPDADKRAIAAYAKRAAEISRDPYLDNSVPLIRFLQPMFKLAEDRTQRGGDPILENRALVTAMSFYVNGTNVARLIGVPVETIGEAAPHELTLRSRHDFAQHFLTSAVITVAGGDKLADAIGLFKEVDDSHGGTGFSFNDIAADRAGVRFGEMAVRSAEEAKRLQSVFADGPWESDFMPEVDDLPEFLSAERFKQEYERIGSVRYNAVVDKIEARIAKLKLHAGE